MTAAVTEAPPGTPAAGSRPWWSRPSFTVLVAAVAVLVGFVAGVMVPRPVATPDDHSAEAGFARDMITHHDQAVEMGMIAYDRATLPGVRQVAYDIATTQQGQLGMMHQWLRDWGLGPTGPDQPMAWMPDGDVMAGSPMPGMASTAQMRQLAEAEGFEVDRLFLELMTFHHLGGIHMVDGVLDLSDHPDVSWLAGLMKEGQQREMQVLRDLQAQVDEAAAQSG